MQNPICLGKCDTHGPVIECGKCEAVYCKDCFKLECPLCIQNEISGNVIKNNRPETGVMQFGDDWPGLFIRGDDAAYYAIHLQIVIDYIGYIDNDELQLAQIVLKGFMNKLQSSKVPVKDVQILKTFNECIK